jgi:hypothetical protein
MDLSMDNQLGSPRRDHPSKIKALPGYLSKKNLRKIEENREIV